MPPREQSDSRIRRPGCDRVGSGESTAGGRPRGGVTDRSRSRSVAGFRRSGRTTASGPSPEPAEPAAAGRAYCERQDRDHAVTDGPAGAASPSRTLGIRHLGRLPHRATVGDDEPRLIPRTATPLLEWSSTGPARASPASRVYRTRSRSSADGRPTRAEPMPAACGHTPQPGAGVQPRRRSPLDLTVPRGFEPRFRGPRPRVIGRTTPWDWMRFRSERNGSRPTRDHHDSGGIASASSRTSHSNGRDGPRPCELEATESVHRKPRATAARADGPYPACSEP